MSTYERSFDIDPIADMAKRLNDLEREVRELRSISLTRLARLGFSMDVISGQGRSWQLPGVLLICTHRQVFTTNARTWTYPKQFVSGPRVAAIPLTAGPQSRNLGIQNLTTSSVEIISADASNNWVDANVDLIAIGV